MFLDPEETGKESIKLKNATFTPSLDSRDQFQSAFCLRLKFDFGFFPVYIIVVLAKIHIVNNISDLHQPT